MSQASGEIAASPSLFEEAYDMTVLACATHFLGRMRLVAREAEKKGSGEKEKEEKKEDKTFLTNASHFLGKMQEMAREGLRGSEGKEEEEEKKEKSSQSSQSSQSNPISPELAAAILSIPITPSDIAKAIDSREEGNMPFLDMNADFGRSSWASVNKNMLGESISDDVTRSLRDSLMSNNQSSPSQTWEIVEYNDERSTKELVYAIAVDDVKKRVVVGFRASVTIMDWVTNLNTFFGFKKNPVTAEEGCGIKQPEKIVMHRGFRNYLFQKDGEEVDEEADDEEDEEESFEFEFTKHPDKMRKIHHILEAAAKILREKPGYKLYTTGYSLGAGLATIFALFAAAESAKDIPEPVTCITIGSPKCGTLSFRASFSALEKAGKLRYLRIANQNDPIKEAPFKDNAVYCPSLDYRHVGMALLLRQHDGFNFSYARVTNDHWKMCLDDKYRFDLVCMNMAVFCFDHLRGNAAASEIGDHHGYSEYMHRLKMHRERLRSFNLDELYRTAFERTVPTRICPCIFVPRINRDGELGLHYW